MPTPSWSNRRVCSKSTSDHVVRILGGLTDTVVLGHNYPGHAARSVVLGQTEINYTGGGYAVTAGVLFDLYEYRDGLETLATLYVQHGVMVDDGPVILSNHLQTVEVGVGGATVSGLSIADGDVADGLTITVEAGHGTLARRWARHRRSIIATNGSDGILSGTGSLAAINQMLADGVTYQPNVNTPPVTDMVTLTINDGHGTDTLNFIFNVTGTNPTPVTARRTRIFFMRPKARISLCSPRPLAPATTPLSISRPDRITSRWITTPSKASGPNDFAHWLASHATVVSDGVLIDLNPDGDHLNQDTILLKQVAIANLHANDFILPGNSL